MNWTDDDLMAYADGELTGERRSAIEAAIHDDAALKDRWAAITAQRQRVAAAFAGVLDEPVPDRLAALLAAPAATAAPARPASGAPVIDLAGRRAEREQRRGRVAWAQWGGLAASLALGLVLGFQMAPRAGDALLSESRGRVWAGGALAQALGAQLAGDGASAGGVRIQLSFVDKAGRYCRTFSVEQVAGLACRDGGQWAVQLTTGQEAEAASTGMRQATTALPRAVLDAVDARIAGDALSAPEERAARDRGWRR